MRPSGPRETSRGALMPRGMFTPLTICPSPGDCQANVPLLLKALMRSCPVDAIKTTLFTASHVTPIGVLRQRSHKPVPPFAHRNAPAR